MTASDKLVTAQLVPGDRIKVGSYTEQGLAAARQSRAEAAERLVRNGYAAEEIREVVAGALFVANRKRTNASEEVRTATVQGKSVKMDTRYAGKARRWYVIHTDLGDVFASPAQTHYRGDPA